MKELKSYQCEGCGNVYGGQRQAEDCEVTCHRARTLDKLEKQFQVYYPTHHKNDTSYKKHCCKCGVLLEEFEKEEDGHSFRKGECIRLHVDGVHKFLEGNYCEMCYDEERISVMRLLIASKDTAKKLPKR